MLSHLSEYSLCLIFLADYDEFTFVSDKQRIKPQKFTGCRYAGFHRDIVFAKVNADTALVGDFI